LSRPPIFTPAFCNILLADLMIRTCTFMLIALVPLYVLDRGYSATVAGLTTTLYTGAALVVRPFSGRLVDLRGRFTIMLAGSIVYCLATGCYLFTIPIWLLLIVRALQGVGFSFNGTALMTMATDVIPESRMSEGIGYLGLSQTLAQAFAPGLALVIKNAYGYRVAFVVLCVFAVLNFVARFPLGAIERRTTARDAGTNVPQDAVIGTPPDDSDAAEATMSHAWWQHLVDRDALRPAVLMFLVMLAVTAVITFLVAYAVGRGIANPAGFFTAAAVAVAVARLTVGRLQARFGVKWVVGPGLLLLTAGLSVIWLAAGLLPLLGAAVLYGLGLGAVQPALNSLAVLGTTRRTRGVANSTFFMSMDLAQAVGGVSLGSLAAVVGMGPIFGVCAAATALAFVVFAAMRPGKTWPVVASGLSSAR